MSKKNNDSCGDCKHNGDCEYRNELEKDGEVIEMIACARYEKTKSNDCLAEDYIILED